jgi:CHAT domain-containing protein/tetratricopeptide (TPR) repeat protein
MTDVTPVADTQDAQRLPPPAWVFLPLWVAANAGGYTLALICSTWSNYTFLVWGAIIGLFQWLAIRRSMVDAGCLPVGGCLGWAIGWFGGAVLVLLLNGVPLSSSMPPLTPDLMLKASLIGGLTASVLAGATQWLAVYISYERSGWWLAASIVGWLLPLGVFGTGPALAAAGSQLSTRTLAGLGTTLLIGVVGGTVSGVCTGVPLLPILRRPKPPEPPEQPSTSETADTPKETTSNLWSQLVTAVNGEPDPDRARLARRYPLQPINGLTGMQLTLRLELEKRDQRDQQVKRDLLKLYDQMLERLDPEQHALARALVLMWYTEKMYGISDIGDIEKNDTALRLLTEAAGLVRKDAQPDAYAYVHKRLGDTYLRRYIGNREDMLEHAVACYQAALQVHTLEYSTLDHADGLLALSNAYAAWPSGSRKQYLERALSQYRTALPHYPAHYAPLDRAIVLEQMARCVIQLPADDRLRQHAQAEAWLKEAVTYRHPEGYPELHAQTLHVLGMLYAAALTSDHAELLTQALTAFQEALRLYNREHQQLELAETLAAIGDVYQQLATTAIDDSLGQALHVYDQALAGCPTELHPCPHARILARKAAALAGLRGGDRAQHLEQAHDLLIQAAQILTNENAPREYAAIRVQQAEVLLHLPLGERATNVEQAIQALQEIATLAIFDEEPERLATVDYNLGTAYAVRPIGDRGINLRLAEEAFAKAKQHHSRQYAPEAYAKTLLGLAQVVLLQPYGNRAERVKRAVELMEEALRYVPEHRAPYGFADMQMAIGQAYIELFAATGAGLDQAKACFTKAASIYRAVTAPIEYASILASLGEIQLALPGRSSFERAHEAIQSYLVDAERFAIHRKDTAPANYAEVQERLGQAYQQMIARDPVQSFDTTIAHYTNALRIWTPEIAPDQCRRVAVRMADVYWARERWEDVLIAYRTAIDAGEQLYRAGILTETKQSEVTRNILSYSHGAYAAACLGRALEALLITDRGKTRLLAEALNVRVLRPSNVPDIIWQPYEDARAAIRATQLDRIFVRFQDDLPAQIDITNEEAARATRRALDTAIAQVQQYDSSFLQPIGRTTIEDLLPDRTTALITFCITERGSFALIACRSFPELTMAVELAGVTRAQLHGVIVGDTPDDPDSDGWWSQYQRYHRSRDEQPPAKLLDALERALQFVGSQLLDPICAGLPREVNRLLLLPVGHLHLLPLHAAPIAVTGGRPLHDRYTVSYAPSIQVLHSSLLKAKQPQDPSLAAVIDPRRNLRFATAEGRVITRLFDGAGMLQGSAATKAAVLTELRGKQYVHLACHGVYAPHDPAESCVECADGVITLENLQQGATDLSGARLATLSACETALVDVFLGSSEEFIGLPAGFLLAGVPCVIGSLWMVDDLSTTLLMQRFYTNHILSGMEIPSALGEAQQWLRSLGLKEVAAYAEAYSEEADDHDLAAYYLALAHHYQHRSAQNPQHQPFVHPYFWAAFTVNGL